MPTATLPAMSQDRRNNGAVVTVAVDGSSRGNPGQAGWAWVIDADRWQCGSLGVATSIVAELSAAHRAITAAPTAVPLLVLTDSQFVLNVATKWARSWARNGWVTRDGRPVANKELVQQLWSAIGAREARTDFRWVRGHAGHPLNEAADRLATKASAHGQRATSSQVAGPGWATMSGGAA